MRSRIGAAVLVFLVAPALFAQVKSTGIVGADLGVTKSSPVSTVSPNTDVSFDIGVTNSGVEDAVTVQLDDVLPAGLTFVSVTQNSGPAFSCTTPAVGANGTITCTIATFVNGASATFTVVAHVPSDAAPGTTYTNVARISTTTFDPNDENNQASYAVTTGSVDADVAITKSGPESAAANANVTFTVVVMNNGPATATTVHWTDTLPGTMTFVSLSQSGPAFTCSSPAVGAGGTIDCTLASMAASTSTTFTLVAHIPANTASGTEFDNRATVTSAHDPFAENDTSVATVTVTNIDVSVVKSGSATVTAGQNTSYTITVANSAGGSADTVQMTDALPSGTTFVSLAQNNGPAASCSTPAAGTPGTVLCTWNVLAASTSAQFTLTVNVSPSVPGGSTLTNTATVSLSSFDVDPTNNTWSTSATVIGVTDVAVTKSGPAAATAGSNITYTITASNNGASTASNVQLSDTVPANTTFVSLAQTAGPAFTCSTGATINCSLASFSAGASATFSLVVKLASNATGSVSNTATITTATADTDGSNNTSTTTAATISSSADLGVTKSGPATAVQNQDVTYSITAANNGPSDASTVTLTDTVPSQASFVSMSQTAGPAFTCSGTTTVTCTIASFTAGSNAAFTLVVHTNAAVSGGMVNTVHIGSSTSDPNSANDNASAATNLVTADLAITKSGSPASVSAGGNISYTIVVTNNGAADATGVTLNDALPANTTFVSMTQNAGPVFTCSGTGPVSCSIASLANGASATFTLVVKTATTTPAGPLSNTATVSAASPLDPTPANNSATAQTTILLADLAVTKAAAAPTVVAGNNATWTIVATNNGPSPATAVTLTDTLPPNSVFVSMVTPAPGFSCSGTGPVICTAATMASGASATFTLTTTVSKTAPAGPLSNTASVSAASPLDPTPSNNSATASTTVTLVDLAITKSVSAPPYGTGLPVTWTLTVTNGSSSTASGVVVTDVLPAGSTLVSATPSQGSCSGTITVTCSLGTLAGGASASVALNVTLPATAGPVTNIASVTSANGDSNPANDSASSTITVIAAAQIPALDSKSLLLLAAALSVVAAFMMKRE